MSQEQNPGMFELLARNPFRKESLTPEVINELTEGMEFENEDEKYLMGLQLGVFYHLCDIRKQVMKDPPFKKSL